LIVTRSFRYRAYPTRCQVLALEEQLGFCCELYNAALEQRRTAWRQNRKTVTMFEQFRQLTDLRASDFTLAGMNATAQRDPLKRLDRAFKAFFRRLQSGEAPGYPRFRSRRRYDTLTFAHDDGARIRDGRVALQGIGDIRINWHRPLPADAEIRTIAIKRSAGRWHISFVVKTAAIPLDPTGEAVGVDLGVSMFATLSTGEQMIGPRAGRKALAKYRNAQRRVSRGQKGSVRRANAVVLLQRQYEHVENIRRDHAHKLSRTLVDRCDLIAVEKLQISNMVRARPFAREISDQAWGRFLELLAYKAESAGREVVQVGPRGTSQECSACGGTVTKTLAERVHSCPCGLVLDRDVNAARNVLKRALGSRVQASTWGDVPCVA
jgi:putative transposase